MSRLGCVDGGRGSRMRGRPPSQCRDTNQASRRVISRGMVRGIFSCALRLSGGTRGLPASMLSLLTVVDAQGPCPRRLTAPLAIPPQALDPSRSPSKE